MFFSKYRAQNRETAGSSDFWSILASSVQTHEARMCSTILKNQSDNQSRPKKRRKIHTVTQQKWNWKYEQRPNEKLFLEAAILHVNQMKLLG